MDCSTGTAINQTIIGEENKQYARYLAKMWKEDGASATEVFLKFAVNYNITAHRLLALRPILHSCTRVVGDAILVIMECLPGVPLSMF